MKRSVSRISALTIVLAVALALAACSLLNNGCDFINHSSYTVDVYPLQDSWSYFELAPGATHSISVKEDYVLFTYSPTSLVKCDQSNAGKAIFTDR